jgi:tyrosyl-tRNA synthetase
MDKIDELLTRGVEEVIEKEHLAKRLQSGQILRVKLGIDPTAKDLHLGHTVVLRKLRQFQDLGHKAVLIIGDFTATIGDPSGRSEQRPVLTPAQAKVNMKNYLKEAGKVLDLKKTEVRHNSEWYKDKGLPFLMDITSKFTVARITERDDFQKRIKDGRDVSMLEILYPILQGYDSVEVRADVEIGGTDQKFNLLMGRKVQRRYNLPEQDVLTVPLIEGLDGVKKMSKSTGNYIGLSESPQDMFGKLMSIPDDLMYKYFYLLTDEPAEEIQELLPAKHFGIPFNPKAWKEKLALKIVGMYHSQPKAVAAQQAFTNQFSKGELPTDIPTKKIPAGEYSVADLAFMSGLASSKTEARRLLEQNGIKIDQKTAGGEKIKLDGKKEILLQVGKRKFIRLK